MTATQRQKLKQLAEAAFTEQAERTAWSMVRFVALQTNTIESRAIRGVELMEQEGFIERFEHEDSLFYKPVNHEAKAIEAFYNGNIKGD